MKTTKFVVKVNRGGTDITEYVKRIDRTPIRTTSNPKLALVMGRFTAEDAWSNPSKILGAPHG